MKNKAFKLFMLLLLSYVFVNSQDIIVLKEKVLDNGDIVITADNASFCPMTIELDCSLENVKPNQKLPLTKVLRPNEENQVLLKLRPEKERAYGYGFEYIYFYGDVKDTSYNRNFVYQLPYEQNESYFVTQGYNGSFSHQNKKCLDFQMPLSAKICASRNGIVIKVKEDSNKGCPKKSCADHGNHIIVYHDDGTFAEYYHLAQNGSLVKEGQQVKQGDIIGLCGNTGWSDQSHLHFGVYLPRKIESEYCTTKFLTKENKVEVLIEDNKY